MGALRYALLAATSTTPSAPWPPKPPPAADLDPDRISKVATAKPCLRSCTLGRRDPPRGVSSPAWSTSLVNTARTRRPVSLRPRTETKKLDVAVRGQSRSRSAA